MYYDDEEKEHELPSLQKRLSRYFFIAEFALLALAIFSSTEETANALLTVGFMVLFLVFFCVSVTIDIVLFIKGKLPLTAKKTVFKVLSFVAGLSCSVYFVLKLLQVI
ncbi:MAG: hypothetical protein ACK5JF_08660 [Oscillospiraceae bacterium]